MLAYQLIESVGLYTNTTCRDGWANNTDLETQARRVTSRFEFFFSSPRTRRFGSHDRTLRMCTRSTHIREQRNEIRSKYSLEKIGVTLHEYPFRCNRRPLAASEPSLAHRGTETSPVLNNTRSRYLSTLGTPEAWDQTRTAVPCSNSREHEFSSTEDGNRLGTIRDRERSGLAESEFRELTFGEP